MFENLRSAIVPYLAPIRRRFHWSTYAPLALCTAFIVSVGPHLQTYAVSLLTSDATSIYGSAYQDAIARFPGLRTWLGHFLSIDYLICAALIALPTSLESKPRQILGAAAISSFIALTLHDIILALYTKRFAFRFLAENVFSNALGGLMIGAILVSIYIACELFFRYTATPAKAQRWLSAPLVDRFRRSNSNSLLLSCFIFLQTRARDP